MKKTLQGMTAAVVLLAGTLGIAQEGEWNWNVTPYGWLAGMEGDVAVGPVESHVDQSFSDVLEDLNFAAMLALDGNNGTWGVLGDLFYVNLDDSQQTAIGKVSGDVEQLIAGAVPYYRVVSDGKLTVDVGAGGRYTDTDVDVSTPAANRSGSRDWIDPVILARLRVQVAEKCYLSFTGDIGGFGVESDLTWQLVATAGHSITENVDILLGYRHLDVDFEEGSFVYDLATSGFAVGVRVSL